jgi:hypothetical protein
MAAGAAGFNYATSDAARASRVPARDPSTDDARYCECCCRRCSCRRREHIPPCAGRLGSVCCAASSPTAARRDGWPSADAVRLSTVPRRSADVARGVLSSPGRCLLTQFLFEPFHSSPRYLRVGIVPRLPTARICIRRTSTPATPARRRRTGAGYRRSHRQRWCCTSRSDVDVREAARAQANAPGSRGACHEPRAEPPGPECAKPDAAAEGAEEHLWR